MKEISNLMNYRDSIKVVDATLRDGGLVNDFFFTDKFVHDLYLANIKAGVDYMEFGYKGDKEMFDKTKFGKWKFCDEDDLRAVVGDNDTDLKIAVMADVGRCNYKEDIIDRNDSVIDLIRVATYLNQIPTAVDMIENAKNKGYEVSCNIMAISTAQEGDLRAALDILGKSPVDVIYIVDSFGAMYPEQMQRLAALYVEYAEKYGKKIGIHAHNNQQLAFANTIEAVGDGVDWLDATYASMGRGAGNCAMELLLGFLKNPKYNVFPVIKFIDEHMTKMREQGVVWGYDLQYLMTGLLNQHPRTAIAFTKDNRNDYAEFYKEIVTMD
ncbi:aldolase catalytic domain-containing protein [Ruminococcus albus]|uniref:Nucleoid-structuring protein H-NS n=1 Tax=Ruminococcus albus SY3 TaxID=1341156 RepID=A0A011VSR6_RUMAL|nr:aldolase catalytic domain-containing protein [Ruminococcus albus]EXM38301.1 nucleoid-structuring protein H-NS [Ruminococcus albus SY3]EXM38772.1 nucleoid-structuring protein H-NS [Ruminococcus albus SY3]MBP5267974.1 aldolase catalytic domain-containing protein [Ruminococcus sp.]